jgi:V8-like Glu-specific endopeptidase
MPKYFRSAQHQHGLRALLMSAIPAAFLIGAASTPAIAQTLAAPAPNLAATQDTDAAVRAYWTPERLRNAKPLALSLSGPLRHGHASNISTGARQTFQGAFPTEVDDGTLAMKLFDLPEGNTQTQRTRAPITGSSGLPFTTNRLYPQNDTVLYKAYPYATIGQLYFTEPGGDYVCSASVIRNSVIATAGHCVADGAGHYYTNWYFVPAENGSQAPYGGWTWSNADTTSSWWNGGGTVPNDQDDALIILAPQKINGKGKVKAIGAVTGYLGYEFNAPLPTAITQIGYPCNLDSCVDPVATYAQNNSGPNNNFQWGTASFGGASGGPEIQDFGQAPSGVPSETLGGNIVVSSTSYTYTTAGVDEDGGSVFYAPGQNGEYTFGDLINWACSQPGAC